MKITIEIELGNDAMQTREDVFAALDQEFGGATPGEYDATLRIGHSGGIMDLNGNNVGKWEVTA